MDHPHNQQTQPVEPSRAPVPLNYALPPEPVPGRSSCFMYSVVALGLAFVICLSCVGISEAGGVTFYLAFPYSTVMDNLGLANRRLAKHAAWVLALASGAILRFGADLGGLARRPPARRHHGQHPGGGSHSRHHRRLRHRLTARPPLVAVTLAAVFAAVPKGPLLVRQRR